MEIQVETCRLCLNASEPTLPIYERLSLAEITELLQDAFGIQISNSEEYTNVCNDCEMKTKLIYSIWSEFKQSDKLFSTFLERKHESLGIPLIDEAKESIGTVSVLPLEPLVEEKLESGMTIGENSLCQEEEKIVPDSPVYSSDDGDVDNDDPDVSFHEQDDSSSSDDEKPSTSKQLMCYVCKGFTGTERTLVSHLRDQHSNLSPYYCDRCLVSLDDVLAINHHHQGHELPFGCLYCEDMYATEAELESHLGSCTGYGCCQCTNQFQFLHQLREHKCGASKPMRMRIIKAMVGSRRTQNHFIPQFCGMCNEDMGKNCRLAQHFEREHASSGIRLYSCDVCPQKFTLLLAARLHRLTHKKDGTVKQRKVPPVESNDCAICSRVFKFNKELISHMETEHADAGLDFHQCHKCDKKFTSEAKLLKHDYNTHQGKQPQFFCSFCGRVFNKKLGLRDHENIHRGIREYNCKECNKDFTYKSTYDRHMQVVHSDAKQFTCEYCHKSFKRKPTLKVHLRLHTGEKPYQCEYCSRRFVDPSSFHKHKQKEHGWKSGY